MRAPRLVRRAAGSVPAVAVMMALAILASAHDLGQSASHMAVNGAIVTDTLAIDLLEIPGIDADRNGKVSYAELDREIGDLFARLQTHFVVTSAGATGEATVEEHRIVDDHEGQFTIVRRFAAPVTRLQVTSTLGQLGRPDHQHLVSVLVGGRSRGAVLDASNPSIVIDVATAWWTMPRLLVAAAIALMLGRYALFRHDRRRLLLKRHSKATAG